jgi:galactokinase
VNLIGEHIDYNHLPVLPVALDREVRIAFRPRSDELVRVVNVDPAFESVEFQVQDEPIRSPAGHWGNYLKAAAATVSAAYGGRVGIDALVTSTLPVAAGLSSSSALVVATALALLDASGLSADPLELADAVARGERYTGTQGGGMDQTISLCALRGYAARIDFDPVRVSHVPIPAGWAFAVVDTGTSAEKSGAAQEAYNQRTRECADALARVRDHLGLSAEVQYRDLFPSTRPPNRPPPGAGGTEVSEEELLDAAHAVLPAPLLGRFRHVITEAERVDAAIHAMEAGDIVGFGTLMSLSHRSLRDDYEVSAPPLDELVSVAIRGGAYGARLTGAGFGGSVVMLTEERRYATMAAEVRGRFLEGRRGVKASSSDVIRVVPSGGASVEAL